MAIIPLGLLKSRDYLREAIWDAQRCDTLYEELQELSLLEVFIKNISILRSCERTADLVEHLPPCGKWVFNHLYRLEDPLEKIQTDFFAIMCGKPIFQSFRGLSGGVTFARGGKFQLVFKWTSPWEMACHRIFTQFIKIINIPTIHIPEAKDLSASPPPLRWLVQPAPDPCSRAQASCLILFAKVPGATLLDFIAGRYTMLNRLQKNELWHGLGKIAMIDLILAHQDRLFKLDLPWLRKQDGDFGLYANLGNLIINIVEDTLHFHLIDNGSELNDARIKYLRPFFNKKDSSYDALIEIMKMQVIEALNRATFPFDKTEEIHTNFEAFKRDILTAEESLKSGMKEMMIHIQATIPRNLRLFKNTYPAMQEKRKNREVRQVMSRLVACAPPAPYSELNLP
jgi:hypothetical protein